MEIKKELTKTVSSFFLWAVCPRIAATASRTACGTASEFPLSPPICPTALVEGVSGDNAPVSEPLSPLRKMTTLITNTLHSPSGGQWKSLSAAVKACIGMTTAGKEVWKRHIKKR